MANDREGGQSAEHLLGQFSKWSEGCKQHSGTEDEEDKSFFFSGLSLEKCGPPRGRACCCPPPRAGNGTGCSAPPPPPRPPRGSRDERATAATTAQPSTGWRAAGGRDFARCLRPGPPRPGPLRRPLSRPKLPPRGAGLERSPQGWRCASTRQVWPEAGAGWLRAASPQGCLRPRRRRPARPAAGSFFKDSVRGTSGISGMEGRARPGEGRWEAR